MQIADPPRNTRAAAMCVGLIVVGLFSPVLAVALVAMIAVGIVLYGGLPCFWWSISSS